MTGIILAISAGLMLGFYAMPEKFVKNYAFENTWGLCFTFMLWLLPPIVAFSLIDDFGGVLTTVGTSTLLKMGIPGFLWGVGMLMWGKAINHIGVSLGFSLFIGTIILVGSLLPFFIVGLPQTIVLITILAGILIILIGIIANGRAGILRQKEENADKQNNSKGSMTMGIIIAVVGGLLATGFNVANEIGKEAIEKAVAQSNNDIWLTSVTSMFIVYVSGGCFVIPFFIVQISRKKMWNSFKVTGLGSNVSMTALMAALNFAASVMFAYSAFVLGKAGGTVGYAIYNTMSVVVAVVGGLIAKEWITAPQRAKTSLYIGLLAMIIGVIVIAVGNSMAI